MSHKEDSSIPLPCQSIPVDVGASEGAFPGFRAPSYTMVPDELFDDLMADLSGAALKVLLYIVRRTFGFKKQSDDISLAQICHGIITKEGRVLDHGTGLSKSTVQLALKELLAKNVLFAAARVSAHRGHEATTYRLNIHSTADQAVAPVLAGYLIRAHKLWTGESSLANSIWRCAGRLVHPSPFLLA